MFKKFYEWVLSNIGSWILTVFTVMIVVVGYQALTHVPNNVEYKDFKEGIQNHLVWSIKGECFFVRPQTELTVHLVRVADCDKK